MLIESSCTLSTDAGMQALWAPEPFANIHDYDTGDAERGEDADIQRYVAAGNLVPINIGSDGAFAFVVRVDNHSEPPSRAKAGPTPFLWPPASTASSSTSSTGCRVIRYEHRTSLQTDTEQSDGPDRNRWAMFTMTRWTFAGSARARTGRRAPPDT